MSKYGIAYSDLDSSFHQDNAYGYNVTPELYSGVTLNLDDNRKRLKEKAMLNLALDTLDILDSGWNGYSATPVSSKSILRAKQFIEELYPNKKYPDKVSHDGDGGGRRRAKPHPIGKNTPPGGEPGGARMTLEYGEIPAGAVAQKVSCICVRSTHWPSLVKPLPAVDEPSESQSAPELLKSPIAENA